MKGKYVVTIENIDETGRFPKSEKFSIELNNTPETAEELVHWFRTIMFAMTYDIDTIRSYMPTEDEKYLMEEE